MCKTVGASEPRLGSCALNSTWLDSVFSRWRGGLRSQARLRLSWETNIKKKTGFPDHRPHSDFSPASKNAGKWLKGRGQMKGTVESNIVFAVLTAAADFRAGRCSSLARSKKSFDIFLPLFYLRLFVHCHTLPVVITLFCTVLNKICMLFYISIIVK